MSQGAIAQKRTPITSSKKARVLFAGCLAHIVHDGLTDMLYVLFPVWQQAFSLNFTQIGLLKSLFSGSMSLLQIPSGLLVRRMGIAKLLCVGTLLTGLSVAVMGWAYSPIVLGLLLMLGGAGSSTQHPLASSAISSVYEGKESRIALSTYNFSGDIGKLIIPATAALLISFAGWRKAITVLGAFGVVVTALIWMGLRGAATRQAAAEKRRGVFFPHSLPFLSLSAIGILDSATRMGFLTFLPFLLRDKGAGVPATGLALSLIFAGGAIGKFVCGVVAERVGILATVIITEFGTAALIYTIIGMPLKSALLLGPLLGIALNGTSSVLYGSVPELVSEDRRNEAFAFFYTCTIGAGAISPLLYGLLSDATSIKAAVTVVSIIVLATIPLTVPLRGRVGQQS